MVETYTLIEKLQEYVTHRVRGGLQAAREVEEMGHPSGRRRRWHAGVFAVSTVEREHVTARGRQLDRKQDSRRSRIGRPVNSPPRVRHPSSLALCTLFKVFEAGEGRPAVMLPGCLRYKAAHAFA